MGRDQAELDRIRELGRALETARLVAFHLTQGTHNWVPVPGSPLEAERSDLTPTPSGKAWGHGLEHPEEMVRLWFELGSHHLYTSGIQMQHDPMLMTAPWPSVRAAVEHFATLAWVCAPTSPDGSPIDARGRVARAALVELDDQRYIKNASLAAAVPGPPTNNVGDPAAVAAYESYRDGITKLFPTFEKKKPPTIDGDLVLPNHSDRIGQFARDHLQGGSGWYAYNLLSQNTHPTRTALLALREPVGDGYRLRAPLEHFEGLANLGLVCQYAAIEELFRWYGWPRSGSTLGSLEAVINNVLPGAIGPVP